MRRTVWLDRDALELAVQVLRDDRSVASQREPMSEAMRADYDRAEAHLVHIFETARVRQ